jgi:hypothetical protein
MIWWGYAGFSGAIVASMALIASIMGVQTEAVLSLVARSGVMLLALGVTVHLLAIVMRPRPPKRVVPTPVVVATRGAPSAALLAPKAPVRQQPTGSAAVLWPAQKAMS